MSKYSLIDLPVYVQPELYEINISQVASALMNHGKVESVYRIGSVTAPGISDLDMLVVFKDGTSTNHDPLKKLDDKGHYLFVHRLFGVSVSHFQNALGLIGWSLIYFWRAYTEEIHLQKDIVYVQYMQRVKWRFIPGIF